MFYAANIIKKKKPLHTHETEPQMYLVLITNPPRI